MTSRQTLPNQLQQLATKTAAIQRMVVGFKLHEAPHMGSIGGNDPEQGSSQLLGVLGFRHFGPSVYCASSKQPFSLGPPQCDSSVDEMKRVTMFASREKANTVLQLFVLSSWFESGSYIAAAQHKVNGEIADLIKVGRAVVSFTRTYFRSQ